MDEGWWLEKLKEMFAEINKAAGIELGWWSSSPGVARASYEKMTVMIEFREERQGIRVISVKVNERYWDDQNWFKDRSYSPEHAGLLVKRALDTFEVYRQRVMVEAHTDGDDRDVHVEISWGRRIELKLALENKWDVKLKGETPEDWANELEEKMPEAKWTIKMEAVK